MGEPIRSKQSIARHRKIFIQITICNVERVVVVWVVRSIVDKVAIEVLGVSHRIVFVLRVIRSVGLHLGGVIITNLAATVLETTNADSDVKWYITVVDVYRNALVLYKNGGGCSKCSTCPTGYGWYKYRN